MILEKDNRIDGQAPKHQVHWAKSTSEKKSEQNSTNK